MKEETKNLILIYTYSSNNEILRFILKDLVWSLIRYKEDRIDDCVKLLGEVNEHCHRHLFDSFNELSNQRIILAEDSDKEYVKRLRSPFFPQYDLADECELLVQCRDVYDRRNTAIHLIIPETDNNYRTDEVRIPNYIKITIKMFLLAAQITNQMENHRQTNPLTLKVHFKALFREHDAITEATFIEQVISILFSDLKDELTRTGVIEAKDISTSVFLQNYYPIVYFEDKIIEHQLDSKEPVPFRADGPHLTDFARGNWVYIPDDAEAMYAAVTKGNSILIEGQSASGKTVITRYLGYRAKNDGVMVFYIDCIRDEADVEGILDRLQLDVSMGKFNDMLFIVENIHIISEKVRFKLNGAKQHYRMICTRRVDGKQDAQKNPASKEQKNQLDDSWVRFSTDQTGLGTKLIDGILTKNLSSEKLITAIRGLGVQNLWIFGMILRLFNHHGKREEEFPLYPLLSNITLITKEIFDYFEGILQASGLPTKSIDLGRYLNHARYVIAILSIFSTYETWVEREFIEYLVIVDDSSILGVSREQFGLSKEIIDDILEYLVKSHEIIKNETHLKKSIRSIEFMIPHSRMAKIYANTILATIEEDFPSFTSNVIARYLLQGGHYGSFLTRVIEDPSNMKKNEVINKNLQDVLDLVQDQLDCAYFKERVLFLPIGEFLTFSSMLEYANRETLTDRIWQSFDDDAFLTDSRWKHKIKEVNLSIDHIITRLSTHIKKDALERFLQEHEIVLLEHAKTMGIFYLLYFISRFDTASGSCANRFREGLKAIFMESPLDFEKLDHFPLRSNETTDNDRYLVGLIETKLRKECISSIHLSYFKEILPDYSGVSRKLLGRIIEEILGSNDDNTTRLWEKLRLEVQEATLESITNTMGILSRSSPKLAFLLMNNLADVVCQKFEVATIADVAAFFDCSFNSIDKNNASSPDNPGSELIKFVREHVYPDIGWITKRVGALPMQEMDHVIKDFSYSIAQILGPEILEHFLSESREILKAVFLKDIEHVERSMEEFAFSKRYPMIYTHDLGLKQHVIDYVEKKLAGVDLPGITAFLKRLTMEDVILIRPSTHRSEKYPDDPSWSPEVYFSTPRFCTAFDAADISQKKGFTEGLKDSILFEDFFKVSKARLQQKGLLDELFPPQDGKYGAVIDRIEKAIIERDIATICNTLNEIIYDEKYFKTRVPDNSFSYIKALLDLELSKWNEVEWRDCLGRHTFALDLNLLRIARILVPSIEGLVERALETFDYRIGEVYGNDEMERGREFFKDLVEFFSLDDIDLKRFSKPIKDKLARYIYHASRSINLLDYKLLATQSPRAILAFINNVDFDAMISNSTCLQASLAVAQHAFSILEDIPGKFHVRFCQCKGPFIDRVILDQEHCNAISSIMLVLRDYDGTRRPEDPVSFRITNPLGITTSIRLLDNFVADGGYLAKLHAASMQDLKFLLVSFFQLDSRELDGDFQGFLESPAFSDKILQVRSTDVLDFFDNFFVRFPEIAMRVWSKHKAHVFDAIKNDAEKPYLLDIMESIEYPIRYNRLAFDDARDFLRNIILGFKGDMLLSMLIHLDVDICELLVAAFPAEFKRVIAATSRFDVERALGRYMTQQPSPVQKDHVNFQPIATLRFTDRDHDLHQDYMRKISPSQVVASDEEVSARRAKLIDELVSDKRRERYFFE